MRPVNFWGAVWHGAAISMAMAVADINVVIPSLVADLTGSAVWVGGLAALMATASTVPQIFVARYVEPLHRKRPVLLTAILLRALMWLGLGSVTWAVGADQPGATAVSLFVFLGVFALGGALGGVPYTAVIGKIIPLRHRGTFFATRQATGSVLSLAASALGGVLLAGAYPDNYAAVFLVSGGLFLVSSLGIWAIREDPDPDPPPMRPWGAYFASLREPFRALRGLGFVTWATGFHLLSLPFYAVALKRSPDAPPYAVSLLLGAIVAGSLLGNLAWGRIVNRLGSKPMIAACAAVGAVAPLVALSSTILGWPALVVATALAGATRSGRSVGFSSGVLEIAPARRRPSYRASYSLLSLPASLMPLVGGVLAGATSYATLFAVTAGLMAVVWLPIASWARNASRTEMAA